MDEATTDRPSPDRPSPDRPSPDRPNRDRPSPGQPPVATVEPRRASLAWVVLLVVVVGVSGYVVWRARQASGPRVEIAFVDANGLEAGAPVVYLGTRVGVVREVRLTPDLAGVAVVAELEPNAAGLAREGTRFWIVRPEVSLRGVSGLDALLGPRYLAVQPAPSDHPRADTFTGLTTPPVGAGEGDGLRVTLRTPQLGSVRPGAPVLYRGVRVGRVADTGLSPDATHVGVTVVVDASYAPLVRTNSRFWNAGGVGVDFGIFSGLTVQAGSLDTIVEGAIAFATPNEPGDPAQQGASFELAPEPKDAWLGWTPEIGLPRD